MKDSQEVTTTEIKKKKMRGLWTDCLAYFLCILLLLLIGSQICHH